jgi:polar amino acid transport system permease protein
MDVFIQQYFDLDIVRENFTFVLAGFGETLQLALLSGALALIWGLVLALLRATPGRAFLPIRFLTISYIDVMRGVPLLLVILLISGSLPFVLPPALGVPQWLGKPDPFWYGAMAITITYGAYYAEVYRAGIEAVARGQSEASRSLGMSHAQAMRHVILPQAVRKVIPPMLNDFTALMKDTSLVGVIALIEVVEAGRTVQSETFNSSALTLGAVLFVVVTVPLARVVDRQIAKHNIRFQRGP